MLDIKPKPETSPWLTPYLTVRDVSESLNYYEAAFGFKRGESIPGPDGRIVHAEMHYKDLMVIMLGPEGAYGNVAKTPTTTSVPSPVSLYVDCENGDEVCKRAKTFNVTVKSEPTDMFWGDRVCQFLDPDGHAWSFATKTAE